MSTPPPGASGPRSRYGDAGANPADSMIPPRPLRDDLSEGWVPEDERQNARSPFPRTRLFTSQSLLPRKVREGIRHPWEIAWLIFGVSLTVAGYIFAVSVGIVQLFNDQLDISTAPETFLDVVIQQLEQLASQLLALAIVAPLVIFVARALMYAQMRVSAVRMSPTQFPEGYRMVVEAARAAGLRRVPDAYVVLGNGQINAMASGHGFRRFIMVYSDLFEIGGTARDPQALRFIIGHEVGHIAAGHTSYFRNLFLAVFNYIPVLSMALSRAQEYTADNFGFRFAPEGAAGSIRVLAAGKYLNADVDVDEFADRAVHERGLFTWLANLMQSHPVLTWRAHALRDRSKPGRLIWRPKQNPVGSPVTMVPSAEKQELWPDPMQAHRFLDSYPPSPENPHWGINQTRPWVPVSERDQPVHDVLDIRWAGPGMPPFGGPSGTGRPDGGPAGPNGGPAGPNPGPAGPGGGLGGPASPGSSGQTPSRHHESYGSSTWDGGNDQGPQDTPHHQ